MVHFPFFILIQSVLPIFKWVSLVGSKCLLSIFMLLTCGIVVTRLVSDELRSLFFIVTVVHTIFRFWPFRSWSFVLLNYCTYFHVWSLLLCIVSNCGVLLKHTFRLLDYFIDGSSVLGHFKLVFVGTGQLWFGIWIGVILFFINTELLYIEVFAVHTLFISDLFSLPNMCTPGLGFIVLDHLTGSFKFFLWLLLFLLFSDSTLPLLFTHTYYWFLLLQLLYILWLVNLIVVIMLT